MHLPDDYGNTPKLQLALPEGFESLVLHCCCAPCAGAVLECLSFHKVKTLVYFYNPNIYPQSEYLKRRDELIELCKLSGFPWEIGDPDFKEFYACYRGLEHEKERGARCDACFYQRLKRTALFAKDSGASHFTTTLATSRWKDKKQVDRAGFKAQEDAGGPVYWAEDWRKGGLVTRRYALVKKMDFYNQTYCGCAFSKIEAQQEQEGARLPRIPRDTRTSP